MRDRRRIVTTEMMEYPNPTDKEIEILIPTTPQGAVMQYLVEPGGSHKGPANYRKFFERNGLKLGAPNGKAAKVITQEDPLDDLLKLSKEDLLDRANAANITGRGTMNKEGLAKALLGA